MIQNQTNDQGAQKHLGDLRQEEQAIGYPCLISGDYGCQDDQGRQSAGSCRMDARRRAYRDGRTLCYGRLPSLVRPLSSCIYINISEYIITMTTMSRTNYLDPDGLVPRIPKPDREEAML